MIFTPILFWLTLIYPNFVDDSDSTTIETDLQELVIDVTHIRNNKGQIVIGVFQDAISFEKEKPIKTFVFKKEKNGLGAQQVHIYLKPGVYGISLLDDENADNQMNYNFMRMPTEGFGFSNYYHKGFTRPSFEQFKFQLLSKKQEPISIKIRYM